jgi:chlorobactene glucosyltransferase
VIIFLWAACLSSGAVALYWGAVIYHVVRTWWWIPTARAGLENPLAEGEWPTVCVIVPAHNEEACIAGVARSLAGQEYPAGRLSMVFSLDRCTDGTERVLREALGEVVGAGGGAAEIIRIEACPAGWAGKVNALWTAVNASPAARGAEVLLFVDADTTLDPRCVRACLGLMKQRGLGMLSLLSTLTRDTWFEVVAQPVAGMELVRMYPITRTNHPNQERPFANGQFIMIRREAYERFEGHKAVHWAVLEDVELARAADRAGVPLGVFLADGLLHCRMYSSWAEFRRGWKRIFTESANRKQSRLRGIAWRLRTLGIALPALAAMGAAAGLGMRVSGNGGGVADWALGLGVAGTAVFACALWACASLGNTPRRGVLAFPAGAWLVSGVLLEAARDLRAGTPTEWGGMTYSRDAR